MNPFSCQNQGQSSVMTDQISNLTQQTFPDICSNDRSLNKTVWTLKCDKLHVIDIVEEIKRKNFVKGILSLHTLFLQH